MCTCKVKSELEILKEYNSILVAQNLKLETQLWLLRGMKTEEGISCLPPDNPGPIGIPGPCSDPMCPIGFQYEG